GLEADQPVRRELPVVADVAADREAVESHIGRAGGAKGCRVFRKREPGRRDDWRMAYARGAPGAAAVDADIEAAPVVRFDDRRNRPCLDWKVGRESRCGSQSDDCGTDEKRAFHGSTPPAGAEDSSGCRA